MNNNQVKVLIFVESRYRVNRKRIKSKIAKTLSANEISTPVEVSVAVVGDRKMKELSKKYKGEDKTHNVLSFSQAENNPTEFQNPDRNVLRLGDIVISYPEIIREAATEEVLVDDKVDELVEHGLMHLLGLHHD